MRDMAKIYSHIDKMKRGVGKACHAIDDILNKLGDEDYCPYEDLEKIQQNLLPLTD
jgi:hypothetical protein